MSDDNVRVSFVTENYLDSYHDRWNHLKMAHPHVCFFICSFATAVLVKGAVHATSTIATMI